jgi:sister chromatid cohesion protein PDS5
LIIVAFAAAPLLWHTVESRQSERFRERLILERSSKDEPDRFAKRSLWGFVATMAQTLLVPAASTRSGGTSSSNSNSKTRLTFKGKLYSKGVTTERILRDLKQVQKELSQMEQDRVDTHSLKDVCKQLTQPTLMLHKDKGVKVPIACCLADMLRLFAPDAPFTSHELKVRLLLTATLSHPSLTPLSSTREQDIFQFFIHLLTQNAKSGSGLACPSGPYYADYFYLLDSLSTVKSVILICDVGGAEEMMYDLFKGFLEIVR